jgi:hypothetical protein
MLVSLRHLRNLSATVRVEIFTKKTFFAACVYSRPIYI